MKTLFKLLVSAIILFAARPAFAQDIADSSSLQGDSAYLFRNPAYEWISYQMKITLETEDEKLGFQCFFVNRTDSLMYFNLNKSGIELARVVLTPDSLIYVNKMENEFYKGSYQFLGKVLGFPLDFQMVQAILNGTDFPNFEQNLQVAEDEGKTILISPLRRNLNGTCSIMQQIDLDQAGNIADNDITDLKSMRNVEIQYKDWAATAYDFSTGEAPGQTDTLSFFQNLEIEIDSEEIDLKAEIKNVKINIPGPTRIKIPESFKEIQ